MATEIRNAASKEALIRSYRYRGYKKIRVKTLLKASKRSAGKYKVTYNK